jgi:hypothetical protein
VKGARGREGVNDVWDPFSAAGNHVVSLQHGLRRFQCIGARVDAAILSLQLTVTFTTPGRLHQATWAGPRNYHIAGRSKPATNRSTAPSISHPFSSLPNPPASSSREIPGGDRLHWRSFRLDPRRRRPRRPPPSGEPATRGRAQHAGSRSEAAGAPASFSGLIPTAVGRARRTQPHGVAASQPAPRPARSAPTFFSLSFFAKLFI